MISLARFRATLKDGKVFRHGKWIEVDVPELTAPSKRQKTPPYARVVWLKEMAIAAKATKTQQAFVWVWLQYLAWKADNKPFPVSNEGLRVYGISRKTKTRALAAFEEVGLILVVRYKNKAPVVTLKHPV